MKKKSRLDQLFIKKIKDFIDEGLEITRLCQEDDVRYLPKTPESNFYVWEQQDKYLIWRATCRQILSDTQYAHSLFEEANSISSTSGLVVQMGIEPTSPRGQKMLKNIRIETSNELSYLRQVVKDISQAVQLPELENSGTAIIEVSGKKGKFSFNQTTGSVVFNKIKNNFPPGQQKFIILKTIMISPDKQGLYEVICQKSNFKEGATSNRKIQLLMKEIRNDLGITPKSKKSMPDIFKSVPRIGYRLDLG